MSKLKHTTECNQCGDTGYIEIGLSYSPECNYCDYHVKPPVLSKAKKDEVVKDAINVATLIVGNEEMLKLMENPNKKL